MYYYREEAIWLQQQGEVVSTVERIQTMQNEIQNYKWVLIVQSIFGNSMINVIIINFLNCI